MSLPTYSCDIEGHDLFQRCKHILLETWKETGFGHIEIESERISKDKIRVILRGSTHYRFVITQDEVEQWTSD
ncbi:MAG: hypothetical protein ACOC04_04165 [Halothece sp.]